MLINTTKKYTPKRFASDPMRQGHRFKDFERVMTELYQQRDHHRAIWEESGAEATYRSREAALQIVTIGAGRRGYATGTVGTYPNTCIAVTSTALAAYWTPVLANALYASVPAVLAPLLCQSPQSPPAVLLK